MKFGPFLMMLYFESLVSLLIVAYQQFQNQV